MTPSKVFSVLSLFCLKPDYGMLSGTIMPNESFLFASLRICSCHPRPCGWYEWKLWRLKPGVITQQKTLFIHMSRLLFLFLRSLPFQPHLKTVSLRSLLRPLVFRFFTLSELPHLHQKLLELSLLLILQVIASLSVPQRFPWPITLGDSALYFLYGALFSSLQILLWSI